MKCFREDDQFRKRRYDREKIRKILDRRVDYATMSHVFTVFVRVVKRSRPSIENSDLSRGKTRRNSFHVIGNRSATETRKKVNKCDID